MRKYLLVLGVLVFALGVGCLNYTTDGKAKFHREWAEQNGFPEPSNSIFILGIVSAALGAGSVGFSLGRPRSR